jgi:hypothetical protein
MHALTHDQKLWLQIDTKDEPKKEIKCQKRNKVSKKKYSLCQKRNTVPKKK